MAHVEPMFLNGVAGLRFAIYYPPDGVRLKNINILYIPPFAEEMNRSRSMAAAQARSLAAIGFSVFMIDLYGTGDSDGEFEDASIDLWLTDLDDAADWLAKHHPGCELQLWGVRMGALIGLCWLSTRNNRYGVRRMQLWQPSFDPSYELHQFLRLRIAANLFSGQRKEGVDTLAAMLNSGEAVEVSGYIISSKLYLGLIGLSLPRCATTVALHIDWFEIMVGTQCQLSQQSSVWLQELEKNSVCSVELVEGDRFWAQDEHQSNQLLITETTRLALSRYG